MSASINALIIGGGIGGLAASLALSQAHQTCAVLEQAPQFSELGAGLQMSPNAMLLLHRMGLQAALSNIVTYPEQLVIRSASHNRVLGVLPLGEAMCRRYGAPYATVHRADLQAVLLQAVQKTSVQLHTHAAFTRYDVNVDKDAENRAGISVTIHDEHYAGDYLIGADGLRSQVRQQYLQDGAASETAHSVYRALMPQAALPQSLRSQNITVWLAPKVHVVAYPIRAGQLLNVVVIMHGKLDEPSIAHWNQAIHAQLVFSTLSPLCYANAPLMNLISALCSESGGDWRVWNVYDRQPVGSASQMADGAQRIALLGDAAHPMRPYMAQGAAMAIEDAYILAKSVQMHPNNIAAGLNAYAALRWQRCAKVQARAKRNGELFHAQGLVSVARDAGMQLLGRHVLDVPWLYGGA
jgi:salicylate hydroxylase